MEHSRSLAAYFEPIFKIAGGFADNAERHELVKKVPETLAWQVDGKTTPIRELLMQTSLDTTLVQTAVYDSIVKGASPAICMRQAIPVWPMASNAMTVNLAATKGYASLVAEGAEVPRTTEHPTSTTLSARKYADRAEITQEMLDDALVPLIQYQLEAAGLRVENALNRLVLDALTTQTAVVQHDCAGTNLGMGAVAGAIGKLNSVNFTATDFVMTPEFKAILVKDFLPSAGYFELGETAKTGKLGTFLGVNMYMCNAVPSVGASAAWDYDADSDIGAFAIDRGAVGAIGMRQDITTQDYKDPIRDLVGMVVKARFGYSSFNTSAICGVMY